MVYTKPMSPAGMMSVKIFSPPTRLPKQQRKGHCSQRSFVQAQWEKKAKVDGDGESIEPVIDPQIPIEQIGFRSGR